MSEIEFTAERYCDDVLAGRVVVCRWVRLACERHRRDLICGGERGLWFDEVAARMAVAFFGLLRHSKGEWAGQVIQLEPWQQFYVWTLFGWRRADGTRRFRTSYLEVARKNGKSTMLAGIGLLLLVADGEPGAEIYTAATKRDQARIIHGESVRMVKQSPALKRRLKLVNDNIRHEGSFSKYEPLGRDSNTQDGLNVHGGLIDELHAHKTGEMWDVLETAKGARRQPLMAAVTTAGTDRQSICWQFHDYTEKVLEQVFDDDAWHGVIYTLDTGPDGKIEDWENEENWIKANPNLGTSKKADGMRDQARAARKMPARLNSFLQKELNIWVAGAARWINPDVWRRCNYGPVVAENLRGRRCYGGLDLSNTLDVTALVWVFEPGDDGVVNVLCRFWVPEEKVGERVKRDRVPYDAWIREGWITATPGDVVDYDFILAQIRADGAAFAVAELAYDPWNATGVTNALGKDDEAVTLVEFRQGVFSMNPAMKALEVASAKRTLNPGGNPVLAWMADNLVASMDPSGNLKPDKGQSREKIDGMVALIMGHGRMVVNAGAGDDESVYEERGLLEI